MKSIFERIFFFGFDLEKDFNGCEIERASHLIIKSKLSKKLIDSPLLYYTIDMNVALHTSLKDYRE